MKFNHIILGGTFDHFHLGHQRLIETAFSQGKKVTIGIAKKNLFENKILSETIESYSRRKNFVSDFLIKNNWLKKTKLVPINDIFGTALTDENIDAIVVSKLTYKNALLINKLRQKRGMREMKIIVVDDVLADDGKLITSERIRLGEIDRNGESYGLGVKGYGGENKKQLILPENFREELRKPLGKVFENNRKLLRFIDKSKHPLAIAVGDIIVLELLKNGINPDVKIIDFRSRRKEFPISNFPHFSRFNRDSRGGQLSISKYKNHPGTINLETALKLKTLIRKGVGWLVIDGEEDLLALPAILFAPLGALVVYGQMNLGVVAVAVTERVKDKVKLLLSRFL